MSGRISPRETKKKNARLSPRETVPRSYMDEPPAFSFKHLQKSHCFSKCNAEEKRDFAESIYKRKELSWSQLVQGARHGLGSEKITQGLKVEVPPEFSGVQLIAFRFSGKKPMIGFRERDVFYVLWFDRDFTVYAH